MTPESGEPDHLHEHRDVQGGSARAAVFGVSDGLVSNVGIILGVAGASSEAAPVQVAGIAGLVAGAISMAAGEYNSMRVQSELFQREISVERQELQLHPEAEAEEIAKRYQSRGLNPELAADLAAELMGKPEVALEFHTREEIGVGPEDLGYPLAVAGFSLVAFSVGAITPLIPWFFTSGSLAVWLSVALALGAAAMVGYGVSVFTEGSRWRAVVRQLLFTAVPAVITYSIGSMIGIGLD